MLCHVLCHLVTDIFVRRLARTGFEELDARALSFDGNDCWSSGTPRQTTSLTDDPRIPLSSGLFVDLLTGVYYAMLVVVIYCLVFCCC